MAIAKSENPLVPDFEISLNGAPLPVEAKAHVVEVSVDNATNLPGMFTMEIAGSDNGGGETGWVDDENLFAVGNSVEVRMGYADDLQTLIAGEITGLEPEFAFDRVPSLTVRGYDRRHRLHRGRKTRTFIQKKDSDIAAQIAGEVGLTAQVDDSGVVHDYMLQANQTDMEFLEARARQIQYEVVVEDKTLFFRPVSNAASEILALSMENDLLEFYPRLSSMYQLNEVVVFGWNPKEKKEIQGKAKTGDEVSKMGGQTTGAAMIESAFGPAVGVVSDLPLMTQAECDQIAKASFNRTSLSLVCGEGVCRGRTDLGAGKVIKIDGIGSRFSGHYYVTSATHRCTARGYYTHFTIKRNAL
jgi:phage protein D